jgi:hypothetical protein
LFVTGVLQDALHVLQPLRLACISAEQPQTRDLCWLAGVYCFCLQVFHLPIEEAAKQLGIGQTMLKHYCRKFGIPRWPYRKRQSVVQLIQSIENHVQVHLTAQSSDCVGLL